MVKISMPKTLEKLRFDEKRVSLTLNDLADMLIVHIKESSFAGKDIDGNKFQPLKSKTIATKAKKGYPATPLIGTGKMVHTNRTKTAKPGSQESRVDVADHRKEIAGYHNDGTRRLPKREFFGVGKTIKPKIDKLVALKLKKIIREIK
jgi:secreted PhoX family phosphatase